jgi:hypothetical protein
VPFSGVANLYINKRGILGCPADLPPGRGRNVSLVCKYCEVLYLRTKGDEYAPSLLQGVSDEAAKRASHCC